MVKSKTVSKKKKATAKAIRLKAHIPEPKKKTIKINLPDWKGDIHIILAIAIGIVVVVIIITIMFSFLLTPNDKPISQIEPKTDHIGQDIFDADDYETGATNIGELIFPSNPTLGLIIAVIGGFIIFNYFFKSRRRRFF